MNGQWDAKNVLRPDEIEALVRAADPDEDGSFGGWGMVELYDGGTWPVGSVVDTLAAYAAVVQKVAEMEDIVLMEDGNRLIGACMFCGGPIGLAEEHEGDCTYLQARELRRLA